MVFEGLRGIPECSVLVLLRLRARISSIVVTKPNIHTIPHSRPKYHFHFRNQKKKTYRINLNQLRISPPNPPLLRTCRQKRMPRRSPPTVRNALPRPRHQLRIPRDKSPLAAAAPPRFIAPLRSLPNNRHVSPLFRARVFLLSQRGGGAGERRTEHFRRGVGERAQAEVERVGSFLGRCGVEV